MRLSPLQRPESMEAGLDELYLDNLNSGPALRGEPHVSPCRRHKYSGLLRTSALGAMC